MKKIFSGFLVLALLFWAGLVISNYSSYQWARFLPLVQNTFFGEIPTETQKFGQEDKTIWVNYILQTKLPTLKKHFNNQAYFKKILYEYQLNWSGMEKSGDLLADIFQQKYQHPLTNLQQASLMDLFLEKEFDKQGHVVPLTDYEWGIIKNIFEIEGQFLTTLEQKNIQKIFMAKVARGMPESELQKIKTYQTVLALGKLETRLKESLQSGKQLSETDYQAIRSELNNYGKIYGFERLPLSIIDKLIWIIFALYLLMIGYFYIFKEQTSFKLNLNPLNIFIFFLGLIYLGYNTIYFENILGINKLFAKEDFFLIQWSFISKIFLVLVTYGIITFISLALGKYFYDRLGLKNSSELGTALFSFTLGLGGLIFSLFFLGIIHLLNIWVVWGLVLVYLYILRKNISFWSRKMWDSKCKLQIKFWSWPVLFILVIGIFLTLDVVALMRPIPTGWDALGVYQNNTKLLSQYGYLLSGITFFNWEILMSLGHLLFGSTMLAMFLSFYGLLITLVALYYFVDHYIAKGYGLIASAIYLSLPMVQHFSSSDMKIDNALFFFSIMAISAYWYWVKQTSEDQNVSIQLWFQSLLKIGGIIVFYLLVRLHIEPVNSFWPIVDNLSLWSISQILLLVVSAIMIILEIYKFFKDRYNFVQCFKKHPGKFILGGIVLICVLIKIFVTSSFTLDQLAEVLRYQSSFWKIFGKLSLGGVAILLFVSLYKLFREQGLKNIWQKYSWLMVTGICLGLAFGVKLTTVYLTVTLLTMLAYQVLGIWGGVLLLAGQTIFMDSIPYGLILDKFVDSPAEEAGILIFLVILTLISFLVLVYRYRSQIFSKLGILAIVLFCISLPLMPWFIKNGTEVLLYSPNPHLSTSTLLYGYNKHTPRLAQQDLDRSTCTSSAFEEELQRYIGDTDSKVMKYLRLPWNMTMNITSKKNPQTGDYLRTVQGLYINISFIFMIFCPLILLILYQVFKRKYWGMIISFSAIFWLIWMLSAGQGVIWYGLAGFLGLLAIPPMLLKSDYGGVLGRRLIFIILVLSFCFSLTLRLDKWANQNMFNFAYGKYNEFQTIYALMPDYLRIQETMDRARSENPDRYYMYRMGTFISFFINENDQYIAMNDNQLDNFNCIAQNKTPAEISEFLKNQGFRYMMVDLYTTTIEKEWDGSLHKKFKKFVEFANNSDLVKIIYPRIPGSVVKSTPSLLDSDQVPHIDFNTIEAGIIYTVPDTQTKIRHKGYVFLELL